MLHDRMKEMISCHGSFISSSALNVLGITDLNKVSLI